MYKFKRVDKDILKIVGDGSYKSTVFNTYEWILFLEKNQNAESVVLEIKKNEIVYGYFVGLITKKFGVKIMGSPFPGWFTPDMGFIRIKEININIALKETSQFIFNNFGCLYIEINDKYIRVKDLKSDIKYDTGNIVYIDINKDKEDILAGFKKNGRRDVRAFPRKGAIVKRVDFDKKFADIYYEQLIDVFAKQSLNPFYDREKIYDLVEAFKDSPDKVLALEAINPDGKCIATLLSFGVGEWAYYLGAASFREHQHFLPNEGLFWEFVKHWNSKGVKKLDLVGERAYKLKYNPQLVEVPTIYFEKFPGLRKMKNFARSMIMFGRHIIGIFEKRV